MEILFFAVLAVFICHRLWLVLGRRDGEAPPARPDPFTIRDAKSRIQPQSQPVSIPAQPMPVFNPDDPVSLEGALARIKSVDPSFNERSFLEGARAAFRLIVGAFADGDRTALKPLLGEDVYRIFERTIATREDAHESLRSNIATLESGIDEARLTGTVARITVSFRSNQTNLVRDAEGNIIHGDPKRPDEMVDIWTFARDLRAGDPNWMLVETRHMAA